MNLNPCPWPIGDLLPHQPPMLLLDEALGFSDDEVIVSVGIRVDHPLARPEGVPAHVGMELMAQACGVYVGAHALASGEPVRHGFILGTRAYEANVDWFSFGDKLRVSARVVLRDGQMGVFDCWIEREGIAVAEARLNLYQP